MVVYEFGLNENARRAVGAGRASLGALGVVGDYGGMSILAKKTMKATVETITRMNGRMGASHHKAASTATVMSRFLVFIVLSPASACIRF